MAEIRDVIPAFELFQPNSVANALGLLDKYGQDAWVLAGGQDSFDWLKNRIKRPKVVVDLGAIEELKGIRSVGDGLEIGATTSLTEVARHPVVKQRYRVLAQAAENVALPQIRNQGTLGGNLSQDSRCWYYRAGWPCFRAGGNLCYADSPTGMNREHAILEASGCMTVNPSDTAPALLVLDAKLVLRSRQGERVINAEDYFVGTLTEVRRLNSLKPGELLTAIRIPSTWAGAQFYFEKVCDRQVGDFALVNVAAAMRLSGSTIQRVQLAVNGVAARPLRLRAAEAALQGQRRTQQAAEAAAQIAVQGAEPLQHNGYKVTLMRNLIKRAVRGGAEATWAS